MNQANKVFIDTSFFISFIDRGDPYHIKTGEIFNFLARQHYTLFTSSLVVTQVFNHLERYISSTISFEFLQTILESNITVIYPVESDLLFCYRFLKMNHNHQASLSEIINSNLMAKNYTLQILTFDTWHNLLDTKLSNLMKPA